MKVRALMKCVLFSNVCVDLPFSFLQSLGVGVFDS